MASTMSFPSTNYPFLFPPSNDIDAQTSPFFSFPSPPSSDPGLEFDLESFTHTSPDNSFMLDDTFSWDFTTALNANPALQQTKLPAAADVSPLFSASTPASTNLISPKTSISSFNDVVGPLASVPVAQQSDADTAEALSTHHLQRYLHYKALAAQVEADARATAVLQSQQDFDAFLASCSAPQMQTAFDSGINGKVDAVPTIGIQSLQPATYASDAPQYFAYDPQQQASMAHAQAEAHRQAHDIAAARAQQQRVQTGYWVANTQNAFGPAQPQQDWSRTSISSLPDLTASFQTSPDYSSIAPNMVKSTSLPSIAPIAVESVPIIAPVPVHSAPPSIIQSIESEEEKENAEPILSFPSDLPIPNLHGGGRGYVPGQTPDDPKKRHKCGICGRGFARAFNLKSHIQTHNPVRTKPHQCPHATCKRGFSRLHDLERHRQGIHNDGPLVDNTKIKSVSPSTVRAQSRMIAKVEDQTSDLTATFVAPQ